MENQNVAANYEAYQQQHKAALAFFNKIKQELIEKGEDRIIIELNDISNKIAENPEYVLTVEEFCLLGDLAYLVGMDMTSVKDKFMKVAVDNFCERFKTVKLTSAEFVDSFKDALSAVGEKNIVKVKDDMKDYLLQDVPGKPEDIHNLRLAYKKAFKSFQIPVQYAVDLAKVLENKTLTYQDVLKCNSLIYEHVRFARNSIKNTIGIFAMPLYVEAIRKGDDMATVQRFAIVYFESILTSGELLKAQPEFCRFLHDDEYRASYEYMVQKSREEIEAEQNKQAEEAAKKEEEKPETEDWDPKFHPTDPAAQQSFHTEHPDFFVRCTLEEHLGRGIKTAKDIVEAINVMLQNGNYVSQFYQYLAQVKNSPNRVEYKETWGDLLPDSIKAVISDVVDEKREAYKKAVELLTAEIPDENINRVITYVNDVIQNLIVDGSDDKGVLLTQIFENQIKTWKHLQEILNIIERQYIDGSQYDSYVILHTYLMEHTELPNINKDTERYQQDETMIAVYTQLKQFIFPKEKEVKAEDGE